jgi:hypothetical protein
VAGDLTPGREGPYRVGRRVGRTIYRMTGDEPSDADELIGVFDTRELAAFAVSRMNATSEAPLLAYRMKELKDVLDEVLDEVLRSFHERGHPGYPALRSGWVREDRVAEWRAVLDRRVR